MNTAKDRQLTRMRRKLIFEFMQSFVHVVTAIQIMNWLKKEHEIDFSIQVIREDLNVITDQKCAIRKDLPRKRSAEAHGWQAIPDTKFIPFVPKQKMKNYVPPPPVVEGIAARWMGYEVKPLGTPTRIKDMDKCQ